MIGIIGGSGLETFPFSGQVEELLITTPFGKVTAKQSGNLAFISRHGEAHQIAPHQVNFRANIWALGQLQVTGIIATAAVGALNMSYKPGELIILDDFIDLTRQRPLSFYSHGAVVHTDMGQPFDRELNQRLSRVIQSETGQSPPAAVYVAVEGPRFETRAEIKYMNMIGGSVVGMTIVPEVVLAKEKSLPYAVIGLVTNYACGVIEQPVSNEAVQATMRHNQERLARLITAAATDQS
ncbi:hypothetical protein A2311_05485 [candidate division WOR-1 bacterium RIFOXYB2_FULL_48_7]|uniref:Probable 6-oxopurine nucleoside phosphorylase n=1 Tax=candidate division WOR-1 bacterium RIFOXYB2_FULL_48_7 TaxID=1802583 RepID=A0A1F4TI69_UNCSA|nr:MAG: hypothetical protein A2311_05485 [candidate division WOR-1 bacterium RIFOXYB2_FULL_48_7]